MRDKRINKKKKQSTAETNKWRKQLGDAATNFTLRYFGVRVELL